MFQAERFGESLLGKGLLGEHCGYTVRPLVAERWVEEDKLLNLAEFLQKLSSLSPGHTFRDSR